MPFFKVSRGQWEFTQWKREGEREREEWKEGTETTANRLRGKKIEKESHCRTNSSFTLGEGGLLWSSNDSKHRGRVRKWRGKRRTHEVPVRLKTRGRNVKVCRLLGSDYRCASALAPAFLDFHGDEFRLWGQEERRGKSGEQSEARCWSGDGTEDAVCLLLSWFICSWRGEVYDD